MSAAWRWRNLRLQHRLMLVFSAFCLINASLFSLYALAFAYTVEDAFFEAMLEDEAQRQLAGFARSGQWQPTDDPALQIYRDSSQLPAAVRSLLQAEPKRREAAGDRGQHYHMRRLSPADAEPVWLIAEVSQKLVFRRMRGTVFEILVLSTLAMLAVALLLGWWLAHSAAKPLAQLAEVIASLRPGQLPIALPQTAGSSEVAVLSRGLDDLVQRIRHFIDREKEFTRDASHELRTPLTVIACAAEQIAASAHLDPAATVQLNLVRQAATQLQQTITTLLTIAREEHVGKAPQQSCALLPVVERVVIEQSVRLEGKNTALNIDVARTVQTQLPEAVLHIVLSNLIGNAFAHCAADSTVSLRADGSTLRIGNSHSSDHQPNAAMHPFQKHHDSAGFGLGLAIVQRLSDRYGLALAFSHAATYTEVALTMPPAAYTV